MTPYETTVALIFPPACFLINEKVNPPLGLGYISSYLKKNNVPNVKIYHITDKEEFSNIKADIIGIGFTTPQFNNAVYIQKELRKYNTNSLFIAGGVHPTIKPQECLDRGFDIVVVGEGEGALLNIVRMYNNKEKIPPIYHEKEMINIDDVPFPDYKELKILDYKFVFNDKNFISMFTSRGCPMRCNYCVSPLIWKRVRLNSIDYIKRHIEYLIDSFGIQAIMFQDDIFTINKNRVREIGNFLYSKSMPYRCLSRTKDLTEETVKMLVDTGCIEVGVGFESGNQKVLDSMNKKTTVEQNRMALINCRKYGLNIKAFVLLGTPEETKETIGDTIKILEDNPPSDDVNVLVLYPETWYYKNKEQCGINQIINNYDNQFMKGKIGNYEPTISTRHLNRDDLEHYRKLIFNKFSRLVKR